MSMQTFEFRQPQKKLLHRRPRHQPFPFLDPQLFVSLLFRFLLFQHGSTSSFLAGRLLLGTWIGFLKRRVASELAGTSGTASDALESTITPKQFQPRILFSRAWRERDAHLFALLHEVGGELKPHGLNYSCASRQGRSIMEYNVVLHTAASRRRHCRD